MYVLLPLNLNIIMYSSEDLEKNIVKIWLQTRKIVTYVP